MDGVGTYPTMKDSDIEWVGSVLEHWYVLPLRTVIKERNEDGGSREEMLAMNIARGVIRQRELLDGGSKHMSRADKSGYK